MTRALAIILDLAHQVHIVDVAARLLAHTLIFECPAADRIDSPLIFRETLGIERGEFHAVRMVREENVGTPHDIDRHLRFGEHVDDCLVGHLTLPRGGKAAIESHFKTLGAGMTAKKHLCGLPRSHRVGRRRTGADTVKFTYRFHVDLIFIGAR